MKKVFAIALFGLLIAGASCSKQRALDSIMADQQARNYLMQQMLADSTTRADMADSILNDVDITNAYLNGLVENENSRNSLLNRLVAFDTTGAWVLNKLAEDPDIKKEMRKASK